MNILHLTLDMRHETCDMTIAATFGFNPDFSIKTMF